MRFGRPCSRETLENIRNIGAGQVLRWVKREAFPVEHVEDGEDPALVPRFVGWLSRELLNVGVLVRVGWVRV
jgi:hypothetical protein